MTESPQADWSDSGSDTDVGEDEGVIVLYNCVLDAEVVRRVKETPSSLGIVEALCLDQQQWPISIDCLVRDVAILGVPLEAGYDYTDISFRVP